ncbi:MAG: helix-turn-helix domain-containing protein [Longimicrobiales bacterium]
MAYVQGGDRMVTAARLTLDGLYIRFADDREGVIRFEHLELSGEPDHVILPGPYVIEVHLADGRVEEVPWDFARHFADASYRERSVAVGRHGRQVFGERLRVLRSQQGITQGELAARAKVNRVTIARFEAGERLPRYPTLLALAKGLDLPVDRLLVG